MRHIKPYISYKNIRTECKKCSTYTKKRRYSLNFDHEKFILYDNNIEAASSLIGYLQYNEERDIFQLPGTGEALFDEDPNTKIAILYSVQAKVKNKGYGSLLIKKIIEYLSQKVDKIYLSVSKENIKGYNFYLKNGFKIAYETEDSYKLYKEI